METIIHREIGEDSLMCITSYLIKAFKSGILSGICEFSTINKDFDSKLYF